MLDAGAAHRADAGQQLSSSGERGEVKMRNAMTVLGGLALGAGLMYMLDPERGRRRRALLRDKLVSACNRSARATGAKARHLSNRAKGLMHETRSAFTSAAEAVTGAVSPSGDASASGAESNQPLSKAAGAR
jgi:hypothetical protein